MRLLKKIDLIATISIAVVGIVITLLDTFDSLPSFLSQINLDFSKITVIMLSLIAVHLVLSLLSNEKMEDDLHESITRVIDSVGGVDTKMFNTIQELEVYLAKRIQEAKKDVCDLTWKNKVSFGFSTNARKAANKKIDDSIKKVGPKITYREVFVFCGDQFRIDKLAMRIAQNAPGYSCKYYKNSNAIPRIQFVIVDSEELFFVSSAYPYYCAFRHKALVEIFLNYFNQIWDSPDAITIKDRTTIYQDVYTDIMNGNID